MSDVAYKHPMFEGGYDADGRPAPSKACPSWCRPLRLLTIGVGYPCYIHHTLCPNSAVMKEIFR